MNNDKCDFDSNFSDPILLKPHANAPERGSAEQSPEHPGAKFLAQEIEDSEDELIAGTEEGGMAAAAATAAAASVACENPCRSAQRMYERGTQNPNLRVVLPCVLNSLFLSRR